VDGDRFVGILTRSDINEAYRLLSTSSELQKQIEGV
jgi:hypothetical protein